MEKLINNIKEEFEKLLKTPENLEEFKKTLYFEDTYPGGKYELSESKVLNFLSEKLSLAYSEGKKDGRCELIKKIKDDMPMAWFPGGQLELKTIFYRRLLTLLNEDK